MKKFLVALALAASLIFIGSFALAATNAIPTPIALFETSLASGITSTATSMTLVSATDKDGNSLSGTYAFILDEGTANEEFVNADCTATACTNMTRGLSVVTGTTSITALKKEHRRGVSVKITDAPQLLILHRIINGISSFPNKLIYTSHPTFSTDTDIVDKKYVDDTAFAGAPDASTTAKGVSEEATAAEINSGTAAGSTGAQLFVNPSFLASSNYASYLPSSTQKDALVGTSGTPGSSNKYVTNNDTASTTTNSAVVRADSTGKIDSSFFNVSSMVKKGGDGSDGALTCSSGTTDIGLGSASVVIKNYTSISITGTCAITFSSPSSSGTIIHWRSQGAVTITSSANPVIDLRSLGSAAGTGGAINGNGTDSTVNIWRYTHLLSTTLAVAGKGLTNGGGTVAGGAAAGAPPTYLPLTSNQITRWFLNENFAGATSEGGGGGGGASNVANSGAGGAGGRGAGNLFIEAAGAYTFTTGTINASGIAGTNGANATSVVAYAGGGGAGGGGAGGIVMVIAPSITTSGTVTVSGGNGGTGGNEAHVSGAGNGCGGSGGAGGSNALYNGGAGGTGGCGANAVSTNGSAGSGTGAGSAGAAGTANTGIYGVGNSSAGGGGGGGGAAGLYITLAL